jgi:hypothetical protein
VARQIGAEVATDALTHSNLRTSCTMVVKPTIAPKIAPSFLSQKEKWSKIPQSHRSNPHSEKSTTPCNGLLTTSNILHPILRFFHCNPPEHPNPTSGILSILPLCHNQSPATFANSSNNVPPPVPQIAYPPVAPQITYPVPNNTSPQVKTEDNPLPPPPPQIQELRQQNDTFPTHSTIITITGGSNTNFDTKRQHRDYYWEVNHVAIEGPITQTKWSHIPITISAQDVNLVLFPHTDAMVLMVHIDR